MAMELPVISFEAEINRFDTNPSLISRLLLQLSDDIFRVSSLWTLGALLLAFLATFRGVFRRTKLLILRSRTSSDPSTPPLSGNLLDSDSDDVSSASSSDGGDDDDDDDEVEISSDSDALSFDESDSRVAGSCGNYEGEQGQDRKLRLSRRRSRSDGRFSWSDFVSGKSVVKTWDGLGLGLGFESSSGLISLWDLNRDDEITTSSCYNSGEVRQIPAIGATSPAVIVSAGIDDRTENLGLRVWDSRVGRRIPAIYAEWQPRRRKIPVGIDIRNVTAPLEELTDSDVETWWDADAVIFDGDREICRLDRHRSVSVVSRCRDAVLSYLI